MHAFRDHGVISDTSGEGRAVSPTSTRSKAGARDLALAQLHDRLQARRPEIEQAILTRVYAVSDPAEVGDPTYAEGLRAAVLAAIHYCLDGIQSSERNPPPIPPALLVQARIAARAGVGLDTVLRRCFSGHALFADFLIEEAEAMGASWDEPKRLLRTQTALLERLLDALADEYRAESVPHLHDRERRRLALVRGLLCGEALEAGELAYDLESSHVGLLAKGPGLKRSLEELGQALGCSPLAVHPEHDTAWAWFSPAVETDGDALEKLIARAFQPRARIAVGEPGRGLEGWRETHRQALAALPVALRAKQRIARFGRVALLACVMHDELLLADLRRTYLAPMAKEPDGGALTREALRAYFASGCNTTSAAAASGLNRNTIAKRIRGFEEALGRPLSSCTAECEVALGLEQLGLLQPQTVTSSLHSA